ncbi:MAG TPA: PxxKW family cysteine-rich protein [Syntrophorhabdus sp.]|jgi:hypothetical protein|nr:PxxKW family cysteine-rich protein [Syntrophorhabdus sp.]MDI9556745.1 PxxKW family cysteine-rich protein [Pseudomonadota bacterium]OPX96958.1 MAG: hypothetical protein A4E59_00900 [Syntrophorhabdus sp. PtaB.Bin027]OQB76709.1 MAG: hypothetical protein BWX92_01553 [Deltaproteobacteria bacterium ADurb.Bin135]MBP8745410.1 PxxKW family cysteine-rich protein [Syntrophorhabdus sp.]
MVCETLKPGVECLFMKKTGCSYNGGKCYTIVENCEGCSKVVEFETGKYCSSFPYPAQKWQKGSCSMSSHTKKSSQAAGQKINPLKASKRSAGKR